MRSFIKNGFLMLLALFTAGTASAQRGFDFAQYDLGLGANLNKVYGDAQTITQTPSASLSFTYNTTPFVNYVVELQYGNLRGGDELATPTGREFNNQYTAVMFRGQLQAGEILDYSSSGLSNALKNLYISSGVGFTINKMVAISRNSLMVPGFYTPGRDHSTQLLVPARIGYEIKFFNNYDQPSFKIDLAYQHNFIMGDALDGFEVGKKDSFSQISIGLKLAIGSITSYRKQISY